MATKVNGNRSPILLAFIFIADCDCPKFNAIAGLATFKKMPIDLDEYEKWTPTDLKKSMMNALRSIAEGSPLSAADFHPQAHKRRRKRQLLGRGVTDVLIIGEPTM